MNTQRLQHLITVLEAVPVDHFDLTNWKCGTSACAVGWACQSPAFNAEGFTLKLSGSGHSGEPVLTLPDSQQDSPTGFDAVEIFFGLTGDQAYRLFMPDGYYDAGIDDPKPADVIDRIRKLLGERAPGDLEQARQYERQAPLGDLEHGA